MLAADGPGHFLDDVLVRHFAERIKAVRAEQFGETGQKPAVPARWGRVIHASPPWVRSRFRL